MSTEPATVPSHDFTEGKPGTWVTLVAKGGEIHVIKEVLANVSSYFHKLLYSPNFVESSAPRVKIDHDYKQLLMCVQTVHGIEPCINYHDLDAIHQLIVSGDRFDLPVVAHFCEKQLMRSSNNLVAAYMIACNYKLQAAKEELRRKITFKDMTEWNTKNPYGMGIRSGNITIDANALHELTRCFSFSP